MKVYTFYGQEVVIVELENIPDGVAPVETSDVHALILLEDAVNAGLRDTCLAYDDTYSEYSGDCPIVLGNVRNPENEQRLVYRFCTEPYYNDDLIERELFVKTSSFHDWTSERTRFIEYHTESDSTKEEAKKEWDEITSHFKQGVAVSPRDVNFDDIWDDIEYRRQ